MDAPKNPLLSPSAAGFPGVVVLPGDSSRAAARDRTRRQLLAEKIQSYADLEPDWDCEGGRAPAPEDIENAVHFLRSLPGGDLPRPMVAGDGDVGFIWKTESSYLEVGFCDQGQISFYGKTPDGEKGWGDGDYAKEGVSAALRKLLESVAHVPRSV